MVAARIVVLKSWRFILNLCNCVSSCTAKQRARTAPPGDPLLFEDTSSGVPPMNNQNYYESGYNMGAGMPGGQGTGGVNNLFADPMASAAMMYGSSLANQGKDIVNKEVRCIDDNVRSFHTLQIDLYLFYTFEFDIFFSLTILTLFLLSVLQISRFMSVNKLKYFFAVDTKYVIKKLMLLMFPYTHQVTKEMAPFSKQVVISSTCDVVVMLLQHHFRKCFISLMCLMGLICRNSR